MKINTETRTLSLGKKDCTSCNHGEVATRRACPSCHGTGDGPRGGKGKCRKCYGSGNHWDWDNPSQCPKCHGQYEGHDDEGICDRIALEDWKDLVRWTVVRPDGGEIGRMAGLIGVRDAIVTVMDYGRMLAAADDEEVVRQAIASVGSETQAVKIVRGAERLLADEIAVAVYRNGYVVLPVWDADLEPVPA